MKKAKTELTAVKENNQYHSKCERSMWNWNTLLFMVGFQPSVKIISIPDRITHMKDIITLYSGIYPSNFDIRYMVQQTQSSNWVLKLNLYIFEAKTTKIFTWLTLIWMGGWGVIYRPCWFSLINSEMVKAVTLASSSIQ